MSDSVNTTYTPIEALKVVVRNSLHNESLSRGLYEATKALDRGNAHLCVLSSSCNEPAYKKLIQALCNERGIPLVEVPDNKTIGEMAGLVRYKPDGTVAKVIGCSCIVIKAWGVESDARAAVLEFIKNGAKFQPIRD